MIKAWIAGYKVRIKKERINGKTKTYGATFFELKMDHNRNGAFLFFVPTVNAIPPKNPQTLKDFKEFELNDYRLVKSSQS